MPLIRSAINFAAHKVSESVNNYQKNGNESVQPQTSDTCSYEDSLTRQNNGSLGLGPYSGSTDHVRYEEQYDPRQQSEQKQSMHPSNEPYDGWTPPSPSYAHNEDQRKTTDNSIARPDAARDSHSPAPPQTTGHHHPGQQYASAEQDYANEDRNRADYYQAKYYQAQQSQAAQFRAQSAQFGGDDGIGYYQQNSRRSGRGRGRGRGRRGRGGLMSMLMDR